MFPSRSLFLFLFLVAINVARFTDAGGGGCDCRCPECGCGYYNCSRCCRSCCGTPLGRRLSESKDMTGEEWNQMKNVCSRKKYKLSLFLKNHHLAVVAIADQKDNNDQAKAAIATNDEEECPNSVAFHAANRVVGQNDDPTVEKSVVVLEDEDLIEFTEDGNNRAFKAPFTFAEIAQAFDEAPVGGEKYDIINNNCAVLPVLMAKALGEDLQDGWADFVSSRLAEVSLSWLSDQIQGSGYYSRLLAHGVGHVRKLFPSGEDSEKELVKSLVDYYISRY